MYAGLDLADLADLAEALLVVDEVPLLKHRMERRRAPTRVGDIKFPTFQSFTEYQVWSCRSRSFNTKECLKRKKLAENLK